MLKNSKLSKILKLRKLIKEGQRSGESEIWDYDAFLEKMKIRRLKKLIKEGEESGTPIEFDLDKYLKGL